MKKLLAVVLLMSACVGSAEDDLTLTVENASDQAIASLSVWAIGDDGTAIDDPLYGGVDPIPAGASHLARLSILRCFDRVQVLAIYDDGHERSFDVNQCTTRRVTLTDPG